MTRDLSIVGGYLGSGKTTLINRLLGGVLSGRTAVLVNDFGSINIDAELIASVTEDTIELTDGCVCCRITDDMVGKMSALAARGDLDHVVCEVSGVGDPRRLVTWQEFPGFAPGPVVVCADAVATPQRLRDQYVGDVATRQLAAAEVILVTRTDLAGSEQIERTLEACRAAAPRSRLVVQDGEDPADSAREAFRRDGEAAGAAGTGAAEAQGPDDLHDDLRDGLHEGLHASATVDDLGAVSVDDVAVVLRRHAHRVARAKGTVRHLDGRLFEVQLAAGRVEVRGRGAVESATRACGLVLIAAGPQGRARAEDLADALRGLGG